MKLILSAILILISVSSFAYQASEVMQAMGMPVAQDPCVVAINQSGILAGAHLDTINGGKEAVLTVPNDKGVVVYSKGGEVAVTGVGCQTAAASAAATPPVETVNDKISDALTKKMNEMNTAAKAELNDDIDGLQNELALEGLIDDNVAADSSDKQLKEYQNELANLTAGSPTKDFLQLQQQIVSACKYTQNKELKQAVSASFTPASPQPNADTKSGSN